MHRRMDVKFWDDLKADTVEDLTAILISVLLTQEYATPGFTFFTFLSG